MKVLVGSLNKVKLEAVAEAFSKYFTGVEVAGIEIDSRVPNQPINEQTFEGARNRALELQKINCKERLDGKFFVGIEGGILEMFSRWFALSAICIIDDEERIGYGTSPFFELPEDISRRLLDSAELGDVMEDLTGGQDTKQKQGAVGYFTRGVMNRKGIYVDGLVAALVPFLNESLYFKK
ncbi:MAG: inosine/xanthosine triphosphatase [Dehalococcoidia bacterium]|nr:inosine/xanthosine triphosphatase [Dehalococcoidia bacterium]